MAADARLSGMRHTARLTLGLMTSAGLPPVRSLIAWAVFGALCEVIAVAALLPLMWCLNTLGDPAGATSPGLHAVGLAKAMSSISLLGPWAALGLIAFMLLLILAGLFVRRHLIRSAYAHAGALASRLFSRLLNRDALDIANVGVAPLNDAVINDCEKVCSHVFLGLLVVVGNVCAGLGIALVLALAHPQLAFGLLLVMGLIYLGWLSRVRRRAIELGHEAQRLSQQALHMGQASFQGIAAVQALQAQAGLARMQADVLNRRAELTGQAEWLGEMPRKVVELIALSATLTILLWSVVSRTPMRDLLPLLALYLFAAFRMLPVVQQTFQQVIRLRFNASTVQRLVDWMADAQVQKGESMQPVVELDGAPSLVMKNAWFVHRSRQADGESDVPVLQGASLTVRRSEFVAIVGPSGEGKSTALMLMSGLLRPQRGEVQVGRAPTRSGPCRRVLVPQDVAVWEATLLANVALGDATPDLQRAQAAAQVAAMDDLVDRLPDGWQTLLTGDAGRLSGGERQRLALARAIYVDPDVLLLDEVTSALDPETESRLLTRLRAWQGIRSVILVTHRPAAMRHADAAYKLEGGQLMLLPSAMAFEVKP